MPDEKTILDIYGLRDVGEVEVGIEIEMEGDRVILPAQPAGWEFHEDGSLRGEGQNAEYVLRRPVPRNAYRARLQTLKDALNRNNSVIKASDRCGVHVHINCQKLTVNQVINFGVMYLLLEDIMLNYCGEERKGNLFCLSAKDAETVIEALVRAKERNSLDGLQNDRFRYASVNFSSLSKYGSLEFRAMRTLPDLSGIEDWVDLLLRIKDASQDYKDTRDIVEQVSMGSVEAFVRSVFQERFDQLYLPDMEKSVIDSVRLVQEVAYTKTNPIFLKKKKKKRAPDRPVEEDWQRLAPRLRRGAPPPPLLLDIPLGLDD